MLNRIVLVALLAGALAGILASAMQHALVVPLIVLAERYETDDLKLSQRPAIHDHSQHGGAPPGPQAQNVPRGPYDLAPAFLTTIATIGVAVGYALMMLALMNASGEPIDIYRTSIWAAGGFAATCLAPAIGLAPELPGAASADLTMRQLWWAGTVASTAIGLWVALRYRTSLALAIGAVLLIVPHIIGAPSLGGFASTAPSELTAAFVARSIVIQAILWSAIGLFAGYFWLRNEAESAS